MLMILADITPISQVRKLSFKIISVFFSRSFASISKSQIWDLNIFLSSRTAYYEIIILNLKNEGQVENTESGERKGEVNHQDRTQLYWNLPDHMTVAVATTCFSLALLLTSREALPSALTSQLSAETDFLQRQGNSFCKRKEGG